MKPADRLLVRNGKRVTKASNLTTFWVDFVYTNMLWLVKIATNMISFGRVWMNRSFTVRSPFGLSLLFVRFAFLFFGLYLLFDRFAFLFLHHEGFLYLLPVTAVFQNSGKETQV